MGEMERGRETIREGKKAERRDGRRDRGGREGWRGRQEARRETDSLDYEAEKSATGHLRLEPWGRWRPASVQL